MKTYVILAFLFLNLFSNLRAENKDKELELTANMSGEATVLKEGGESKALLYLPADSAYQPGDHIKLYQNVEVLKSKGRRAIVKFPPASRPRQGSIYNVDAGGGGGEGKTQSVNVRGLSRHYRIDLDSGISFLKTEYSSDSSTSSADGSTKSYQFGGFFAWNFGYYELGPYLSYDQTTIPSTTDDYTTRSLAIGPQAELNFVKNTPGTFFVPAASLSIAYLNSKTSGGSYEISSSGYAIEAMLLAKLFLFEPNQSALVVGLGYYLSNTTSKGDSSDTTSTDIKVKTTGIVSKIGLSVYF